MVASVGMAILAPRVVVVLALSSLARLEVNNLICWRLGEENTIRSELEHRQLGLSAAAVVDAATAGATAGRWSVRELVSI